MTLKHLGAALSFSLVIFSAGCSDDVAFSTLAKSESEEDGAGLDDTDIIDDHNGDSGTADPVLTCTKKDLSILAQILVQEFDRTKEQVAEICIDGSYPTMNSSLPVDAFTMMRFQNSCGNRYCRSAGFESGRVIELNDKGIATLECRHSTLNETGNTCEGILKKTPILDVSDANTTTVARECIDPDVPTVEANMPSASAIRFVNTCGKRYCQNRGFRDGRVTEYFKDLTVVECYRDPSILFLNEKVKIADVARNCIDAAVPRFEDNGPDVFPQRFVTTCANRYCHRVMGQGSGKITEYRDGIAEITCLRKDF